MLVVVDGIDGDVGGRNRIAKDEGVFVVVYINRYMIHETEEVSRD